MIWDKSASPTEAQKEITDHIFRLRSDAGYGAMDDLHIPEENISDIELIYFAMSLVTLCVLSACKRDDKIELIEKVQLSMLRAMISDPRSSEMLKSEIAAYRSRFHHYQSAFYELFDKNLPSGTGETSMITLFIHYVTKGVVNRPPLIPGMQLIGSLVSSTLIFAREIR